jgi:large repetitive protein
MKLYTSILLSMALVACGDKDTGEEVVIDPLEVDDDGDGFTENQGDCDDADAELNPGATEICDDIDNDCDDLVDDEDDNLDTSTGTTFYADADADTFGDAGATMASCVIPDGYVENMDDCDDNSAEIHPDASEICDDIDNDCDDLVDDDDDSVDASTGTEFYMDMDLDGEGDAANAVWACEMPDGAVSNMTDCNDSAADEDGDGNADGAWYNTADTDQDGLTTCGSDDDGDGTIDSRDCDDMNNEVGSTDEDEDGFVACIDDCSDTDAWTYPGSGELEADMTLCTTDMDEDGYGDMYPADGVDAGTDCEDDDDTLSPADADADGVSTCGGDCDDDDAALGIVDYDGDGYSNCYVDCWDSVVDVDGDGVPDSSLMYPGAAASEPDICGLDADGDGYADADPYTPLPAGCIQLTLEDSGSYWDEAAVTVWLDGAPFEHCSDSTYTSEESCNAASETWSTGAYSNTTASGYQMPEVYEVCTPIGEIALSYECTSTYDCPNHTVSIHYDINGDGVYDPTNELIYADGYQYTGLEPYQGVFAETNFGEAGSDCDDSDAATIGDDDGDGYTSCTTDCDDSDAATNPMATETYYDGVDSNCDEMSDYDADMDGYDIAEFDCDGDGTYDDSCDLDGDGEDDWWAGIDCDDADSANIGDADGDGYTSCTWDCDDDATDADGDGVADGYDTNPDATETYYDGVDSNCDGMSDFDADMDGDAVAEWDCDGDGVLDASCDLDGDGVDDYTAGTDCDDDDASIEGLDYDVDGQSTCDGDCDDTDMYTYMGAAAMDDPNAMYCLTDMDGDGYATPTNPCYTVDMADSYGDGWNGGYLVIYEDGVEVDSGLPADSSYTNQTAGRFFVASGSTETAQFCVTGGASIELEYTSGSWEGENSYSITDDNGAVLFSESSSPAEGAVFSFTAAGIGSDCDDNDATSTTTATDADCDGVVD